MAHVLPEIEAGQDRDLAGGVYTVAENQRYRRWDALRPHTPSSLFHSVCFAETESVPTRSGAFPSFSVSSPLSGNVRGTGTLCSEIRDRNYSGREEDQNDGRLR